MVIVFLLLGIIFLLVGGDLLVKSSASLAAKLNVSPFLIGITVVSFGTSAPELLVSLNAAFQGSAGIAIGNVIGSNVANIALVLGLTIIIRPVKIESNRYLFPWLIMLVSSIMFFGFSLDGEIDVTDGLFFISGLLLFISLSIRYQHSNMNEEEINDVLNTRLIPLYFILGATGLYFGSEFLVGSSVAIAKYFHISEFVIGITIVALGTSLPELVTSLIAILKGQSSISIGNLIGSNIFNVFAVLGITSLVKPIGGPINLLTIDLPIMIGLTLLLGLFLFLSRKLGRTAGLILISIYIIYLLFSIS
mgnify:CR=1 FL=1|tara:strand:+ start:5865 stop:6782 length:918 start_codon:yes stop_codon:yes gene_type:complete